MKQNDQLYESYLNISIQNTFDHLHTGPSGLTTIEAKTRLSQYGSNALKAHQISWFTILLRQFKSPFIYLLLGAALLALLLGEVIDSVMILIFVLINTVLGFFQEFHSEQTLKVLKRYTIGHTKVIRDGVKTSIPVDQLVPGDIVELQPGDIIPADLRLIETNNLFLDESVLTGESEPNLKNEVSLTTSHLPIHKATNIAFSATSVSSGKGQGVVIATGFQAYMGTIAKLTIETHQVSSFEKGMGEFSTFVLRLVGITLFIVFFANLMIKGGSANIGELLIFCIALATAVIPEALPLVITFSLSRGAARLAKHKVVVKRLSAIEDLGGIQVLCTDKTGTITENSLTVVDIFGDKLAVLSQANLAINHQSTQKDSFDQALQIALQKESGPTNLGKIVYEIPFDPERKRNSVLVDFQGKPLLVVRGAAEAILPHLKNHADSKLASWIKDEETEGRRVIVVAHKNPQSLKNYTKDVEEHELVLTGAISFTDPLKKSTFAAVKKAQQLGISIKIITGDSPIIAGAVAHKINLVDSPTKVITAQEFFSLTPAEQKQTAKEHNVFARFSPHQKHQLIDILQHHFEVGYLGEGINDAPALKSANVALVVQGASDIAREAADVILLNRSLSVIIDGIQEGREVFANTIKYVKMTLTSNFGNFYAVAIASLIINFLPMLPIQILLVNLLSDFPLIAIATDSVDAEEIKTPESYNLRDFALIAIILGLVSTVFDFIFFGLFYRISPEVLQTNWFMGSILTELVLLYSLRTRLPFLQTKFPSITITGLTLVAAITTIVIPFTSIGQIVFKFKPPTLIHLIIILVIVCLYFISTETVKLLYYRLFDSRKSNPTHYRQS
ncbi:MAG: HAD-IC family P-type ATPase [bacterium]|nr:HAD-IC family P-type ATPase [bacterium]